MMFKFFSNKLYPYLILIAVSIYIATQFLSIASTSNIGVTLEEMATKQKVVFEFLISQSLENAMNTSKLPNIMKTGPVDKDQLLTFLAYNNSITVEDISFFDTNGNLVSANAEGFTSFKTIFGDLNPVTVVNPTIVNIRYSETFDEYVMDILVPVMDHGKIIGLIWQVESFERINSAMSGVSILDTGEFYIIDKNGQVLTQLNNKDQKIPYVVRDHRLYDDASDGFEHDPYLNYENTSVYGYHIKLPLNNWTLVVEVHESEVLNTLTNVNSFVIRCTTLILASSKLLEPILIKQKNRRKQKLELKKELTSLKQCVEEKPLHRIKCYFIMIKDIYLKFFHHINMIGLVVFITSIVLFIGANQIDQSIQTSLNLANTVNARLVTYYLNEQKSAFQSATRTYHEYMNQTESASVYLKFSVQTNNDYLNILLLDESKTIVEAANSHKFNQDAANQAISLQNTATNSMGVSDIFYDSNYNEYVMYFCSTWYNAATDSSYYSIAIVSVEQLTDLITSNELQDDRIFSILNNEKIMYSNTYTISRFSQDYFEYLKKTIFNQSMSYSQKVNKYTNPLDEKVFGSYAYVNPEDADFYASYNKISDTDWQILYEEPVYLARKQLYNEIQQLIIEIIYDYIDHLVNNLK